MNPKGKYSQNEEDFIITDFFLGEKGRLVEIGAYNPTTFSNSRALIELGWEAILVEPSPQCFKNLYDFHKDNPKVQLLNSAIGEYDGQLRFWDSGGACATANSAHYEKWRTNQLDFKEIEVPVITWESFTKIYGDQFNFISIDAEGMDWEILQQIDLIKSNTTLVCIEYTYNSNEIYRYLHDFGFVILIQNGENIILARYPS